MRGCTLEPNLEVGGCGNEPPSPPLGTCVKEPAAEFHTFHFGSASRTVDRSASRQSDVDALFRRAAADAEANDNLTTADFL